MIQNMVRAARLDVEFFNTVEHDESYTGQAFGVVVVAYALAGVGLWLGPAGNLIGAVVASLFSGIVGWVIWAVVTNFVGGRLGGTADVGEMLRVLGFAQAPIAIGIIPFVGWVGLIWMGIAAVVAIREGLDFSTGKAIATLVIGWVVIFVFRLLVALIF